MSSLADLIDSIPDVNRWKLDKEIDFENKDVTGRYTVPKHVGQIAKGMTNWQEDFAIPLGLTQADQADIEEKNSRQPGLQRYN